VAAGRWWGAEGGVGGCALSGPISSAEILEGENHTLVAA
jgi:hypothetical protein